MKYRKVLNRRTFLRGAGSVAVALPFLQEMTPTTVWGAPPEPPVRALTVFFGLGVPKQIAARGLTGPLEPLARFADRLAVVRGVNLLDGTPGGGGNHFQGGGAVFTGVQPQNDSRAGGPSIDQVIANAHYPKGPPTLINTLLAGSFFRRGNEATRYVHSWREDGAPVDTPIETPTELFSRIFGNSEDGAPSTAQALRDRAYQRSVLDSVLDDYRALTGSGSDLGSESKQRVRDHLDQIRELEERVFGDAVVCEGALDPGVLPLLGDQPADPGGDGVDLEVDDWLALWHHHADLYAMAIKCDVVRFGNLVHQSAGERVRLHGDYIYDGSLYHRFDDSTTSHEYWHSWGQGQNAQATQKLEVHLHFIMSQVAYFLEQLDDPNYADANGKTIFDNAFLMMGTELGDGARHDLESVFHAVGSAGGRFRVGQLLDVEATDADLYSTCLKGMGVDQQMGDPNAYSGDIDGLLA